MERTLLRRLPKVLLHGSLLLMLPSLLARLAGGPATPMTLDMVMAGLLFLHWNVVLTVAIGAFIVMVMKGQAFVADAYPLEEADGLEAHTARRQPQVR